MTPSVPFEVRLVAARLLEVAPGDALMVTDPGAVPEATRPVALALSTAHQPEALSWLVGPASVDAGVSQTEVLIDERRTDAWVVAVAGSGGESLEVRRRRIWDAIRDVVRRRTDAVRADAEMLTLRSTRREVAAADHSVVVRDLERVRRRRRHEPVDLSAVDRLHAEVSAVAAPPPPEHPAWLPIISPAPPRRRPTRLVRALARLFGESDLVA